MKKFLITIFISIIFCLSASAKTVPLYENSITTEGIGIISLPTFFKIYEKPDMKSKVLKEFKWGSAVGSYYTDNYSKNFVIFEPAKDIGYMTVVDDIENSGWYKVCYDQHNQLTGWVFPENYKFYYWLSFYTKFGKANGLYEFRDLDLTEKRLYAKPDLDSQVINTFERAKNIRVQIFRGNWVLVRVYDFEGKLKIGWIKWRTDEGKFKFFPNVIK